MKRLALLLADERNPYQQLLVREARSIAATHDIELLSPRFAGGLTVAQIEQFFECLRSDHKPDAIITMLVSVEGIVKTIEMIVKAGVSCVFLNRIPDFLDRLRADFPNALLAAVSPDQVEIGRIQGRQCLKLLPQGGFALYVLGAQTTPSTEERRRGFHEIIGDRVKIHELEGYWSAERAEAALDDWFRLGADRRRVVDLIVCQNDPMARGVRVALGRQATVLDRKDLSALPIIGCDGLPEEGQQMVKSRELIATVVMPPTTPRAIEILHAFWDKGVRIKSETLPPASFPPLDQLARP
jgi:ABC-type sugar transport system substrate-binding protein